MSISEYTISIRTPTAERPRETARNTQRELFRTFAEKYIIGIVIAFIMFMTLIYSVYAASRTEYFPSAIILMVTMGIISYLLEKDGENNGNS